jgi:hypothetical protein
VLWPRFEAVFATKEALAKRFDQLAELRNSIRHSRHVTEIVRSDGNAALLWFTAVLDKNTSGSEIDTKTQA